MLSIPSRLFANPSSDHVQNVLKYSSARDLLVKRISGALFSEMIIRGEKEKKWDGLNYDNSGKPGVGFFSRRFGILKRPFFLRDRTPFPSET